MDLLDNAGDLEIKNNQNALDVHFRSIGLKSAQSAKRCIRCDTVIPEARRLASQGCQYCINCQQLAEKGKHEPFYS